jgi:hypothetical protein
MIKEQWPFDVARASSPASSGTVPVPVRVAHAFQSRDGGIHLEFIPSLDSRPSSLSVSHAKSSRIKVAALAPPRSPSRPRIALQFWSYFGLFGTIWRYLEPIFLWKLDPFSPVFSGFLRFFAINFFRGERSPSTADPFPPSMSSQASAQEAQLETQNPKPETTFTPWTVDYGLRTQDSSPSPLSPLRCFPFF